MQIPKDRRRFLPLLFIGELGQSVSQVKKSFLLSSFRLSIFRTTAKKTCSLSSAGTGPKRCCSTKKYINAPFFITLVKKKREREKKLPFPRNGRAKKHYYTIITINNEQTNVFLAPTSWLLLLSNKIVVAVKPGEQCERERERKAQAKGVEKRNRGEYCSHFLVRNLGHAHI